MMNIIYIAGPYTRGDVAENVHKAMEWAHRFLDVNLAVYCPHLTHFLHIQRPRDYEDWMRLDLEILKYCDALFRIEGESSGADREVARAKELGIPVFLDTDHVHAEDAIADYFGLRSKQ